MKKVKQEFGVLTLKEEFKNPKTISVGGKTIKIKPGEKAEVPRADVDLWLKTNRFDFVEFKIKEVEVEEPAVEVVETTLPDESGFVEGFPGRAALVKKGLTFLEVKTMTKLQLLEVPKIGEQTADDILKFIEENNGGDN